MNRRQFLHTVGGAAVAGGVYSAGLGAASTALAAPASPRARVAVLWEQGFPTVNAAATSEATLRDALAEFPATFLGVDELRDQLTHDRFDVLLTPYGSAFPKAAWPAIKTFLDAGRHWVNLGGVPCGRPVEYRPSPDVIEVPWRPEAVNQVAYHRMLGITQAFPVAVPPGVEWEPLAAHPWAAALVGQFTCASVHEFYVRFTRTRRVPDEDGSDGPREAVIEPLVSAMRTDLGARAVRARWAVAAPIVMIDRLLGAGVGGRWVFFTGDGTVTPAAIRVLVTAAATGCERLHIRPSEACFVADDVVAVTSTLERPAPLQSGAEPALTLNVFDGQGVQVATAKGPLPGAGPTVARTDTFNVSKPGYYRVEAALSTGTAVSMRAVTGFWIHDERLFARDGSMTADAFMLRRDGKPFPVTGTTYMASDVHRQFLLEPNPEVWERDFAAMKRAGVNVVRTGIWTGWSRFMTVSGAINEPALRALDAFMLTAVKHDMGVVFTFFAFVPPAWGGLNPYLDPNAIRAQKRFVTAVVTRYKAVAHVTWDLINEPSFCSPANLWVTRPNGDEFEKREWAAWLGTRYPAKSKEERDLRLQELWRCKPGDEQALPANADFADANLVGGSVPLKALDYRLFAQDMFRDWAKELAGALRAVAGRGQLVTVGQDEGGTGERPSNQFFGGSLDLTSIHTWWYNDDLLWDSVVSKHPAKPNLVQETGVMFYETAGGRPWRTEAEVRDLFERKLAIAIGAGGAGYINWIWNTNPYMPSDNEAAIGLLRPDGTIKPEFDAWRGITEFVQSISSRLDGREREQVLMVVPQANLFSVRTTAAEATKRAVRVMHYHCRVPMAAVGEFNLADWPERPKLILLPSPRILSQDAWMRIRTWVMAGSTLLVTGPFDQDEHWLPTGRMKELGLPAGVRPVMPSEWLTIGEFGMRGGSGSAAVAAESQFSRLSYRGEKLQRVDTALETTPSMGDVRVVTSGQGRILWCPTPIELAEEMGPTAALYKFAVGLAGIAPAVELSSPDSGAVLVYAAPYRDCTLFTVVSESSVPLPVRFTPAGAAARAIAVNVAAGRAAMVLVDRKTGTVVADYPKGATSTRT